MSIPKIAIMSSGGTVTHIVSNTADIEITLINRASPDPRNDCKTIIKPDSVMTDEGLNEFIQKA